MFKRIGSAATIAAGVLVLAACSAGNGSGAVDAASPPGDGAAATSPCGLTASPVGYQHVVWLIFENKDYDQILGADSDAPYFRQLAGQCGVPTQMHAETHPSLPNYIALSSGSTQGITDDAPPSEHPLSQPSVFSQLGPGRWRALQESMPTNCAMSNSGDYAVRHNPPTYFTGIRDQCEQQDVPLGPTPDLSAPLTFITPNMVNDMHDGSVATGDAWLADFVPKLTATPEYQAGTTVIFITFDEDNHGQDNRIATIVVSPSTPSGTSVDTQYTHYSILRTTEELLGLEPLGDAATAASMRSAFNL